jgi:DNA-binding FrmR family transcriptional regulator
MKTEIKHRVGRRLKIIEGQVRGLQRMVEEDAYCIDIITQSSAVREALSSFEDAMLENHLTTHVVEQMKGGSHRKAIGEILQVFRKTKKR